MNPALLALILTQAQAQNLNLACREAEIYGLCKTFQAVVLSESSACLSGDGDGLQSIGCSQIKIQTARKACGCEPDANRLHTDRLYNLRLGARFLEACFAAFWPDTKRGILCYGVGIPAASKAADSQVKKSRYVARVLKALSELAHVRQTED